MLTLSALWFGTILVGTLVAAGTIGARFGLTNAAIQIATAALLLLFVAVPVLVYLLDSLLAARITILRTNRVFTAIVRLLRRIAGLAYPQRLVLPVQLTLQSNTRPWAVFLALLLGGSVIVLLGGARQVSWTNFTISNEFSYLDANQVREGFQSTYYEDMASPLDRLRGWPRIDSFQQSSSFIRLFLPYQPLRDNLLLDQLCGECGDHR